METLHSLAARKELDKRVRLPVSVPNRLFLTYQALAEKTGYTVSDLTEEALRTFLEKIDYTYSPSKTEIES